MDDSDKAQLPRVTGDVMPPAVRSTDTYLRQFLTRASETGAVRYTRVEQWEVVGAPHPRPLARPANRARIAAAVVALVAITALVTWLLSTPRPAGRTGVTVALPGATAPAGPEPAPKPLPQAAAIVTAPVAAAAQTVSPPRDDGSSATPRTEAAALARAFATNEAWPWQAGATRGMVVVGPGDIASGRLCRDVAIMTRAEGLPDRTVNSRKCQGPDGAIVDAEATGR